MNDQSLPKTFPLEEAIRAQRALRTLAGFGPEAIKLLQNHGFPVSFRNIKIRELHP